MNATVRSFVLLFAVGLAGGSVSAQTSVRIDPATSRFGWLTRPYQARSIPPINLANTSRFDSLIRAGNLYVSAQDVIALALENSIDIEVQRYGPLLQRELLRRAESGSLLRNVGPNVAPGPNSVSLSGVSVNTNGAPSGGGGSGVSAGGGIITQLGPSLLSFDPNIVVYTNFQHATSPQSLTSLTGTNALIDDVKTITTSYSQNWSTGLSATLTYASTYNRLNSNSYNINPYTSGDLDLVVTQNLLNGFGRAVNGRNIRVQKNNVKVTDLQFKQQVITTVSAALNLYWDLVAFDEDVRARQEEVKAAEQLLEDNKKQVQFGAMAEIEITRAEAQLYAGRQDLTIAQTNLLQQETVLKNALVRTGIAQAGLANVHVVPLDKIATIPATEEVRPIQELITEALAGRTEIAQARLNIDSNELNLVGIKNSLKPTLQAFAE